MQKGKTALAVLFSAYRAIKWEVEADESVMEVNLARTPEILARLSCFIDPGDGTMKVILAGGLCAPLSRRAVDFIGYVKRSCQGVGIVVEWDDSGILYVTYSTQVDIFIPRSRAHTLVESVHLTLFGWIRFFHSLAWALEQYSSFEERGVSIPEYWNHEQILLLCLENPECFNG